MVLKFKGKTKSIFNEMYNIFIYIEFGSVNVLTKGLQKNFIEKKKSLNKRAFLTLKRMSRDS